MINDSQAAAMGDFTFGKGHQPEGSLIVINVHNGVGAGIIIHGQLIYGDGGGAGEIGCVVVVREGGLPYRCVNNGCLETAASAAAVVQRLQTLISHSKSQSIARGHEVIALDWIEQAFAAGNPLARQVILEAGGYMGMAISNMVGALNIRKVVLVSELNRFGKSWFGAIEDNIRQTTHARLAEERQMEFGQLGRNGIILGASALILTNYSLLFNSNRQPFSWPVEVDRRGYLQPDRT